MPTLYLGRSPLFASRDLAEVQLRLEEAVGKVLASVAEPLYFLQACRIDNRFGLYAGDCFNRSARRSRLRRAGVIFAEDFSIRLTPTGSFECNDWGAIRPEFVVPPFDSQESESVIRLSAPQLAATVLSFRYGTISPDEFSVLVREVIPLKGFQSSNEGALVAQIREG